MIIHWTNRQNARGQQFFIGGGYQSRIFRGGETAVAADLVSTVTLLSEFDISEDLLSEFDISENLLSEFNIGADLEGSVK